MTDFYQPTAKERRSIKAEFTFDGETLYHLGEEVTQHHRRIATGKIINRLVIIGIVTGIKPKRQRQWTKQQEFTHCEGCGEVLPPEEVKIGSAWHFKCWHEEVVRGREEGEKWG